MLTPRLRTAGAVLCCLLVSVLVPPSSYPAGGDKDKSDKERIQGAWRLVSMEKRGKKAPEKEFASMKLYFVGGEVFFLGDEDGGRGTYRLNAKNQPSEIDFTPQPKDKEMNGIYRLETDKLFLCFPERDTGKRPMSFKPDDGDHVLMVLERLKDEKIDLAKLRELAEQRGSKVHRIISTNNLKQIVLAMLSHESAQRAFPAQAICDKDGKPLLSWRVAILSYLEADNLFKQFKLDESWDSLHNIKLLDKIPASYKPVGDVKAKAGWTFYQVFTGPQTIFEKPTTKYRLPFVDGSSNTFLVVEGGTAVPWTKPEDLPYDPKKEVPKLGGLFADGFNACMADGSVRFISRKVEVATLRALITPAGGEVILEEKLHPPKKAP
jgi:uncharacterized protein (TIGR03067 family)